MKAKYFLSLFVMAALTFTSCKNENKKDAKNAETENSVENTLKADDSSATVNWIAYKTTEKVAVKGEVKSVEISNFSEGSTPEEVLDQAEFKIDLMDFSTGDAGRDATLTESFFSKLINPEQVTGQIYQENNNWFVKLKFNDVTVKKLPAEVSFDGNTAHLKTTIELKEFKALDALAALHEACFDLHKGADGESKTWDVVDVEATVNFMEVE